MTVQFFEVGGCVRDEILGVPTKDIDFTVVMPPEGRTAEELYAAMGEALKAEGFIVHTETPDKFVMRARVPNDHPLRSRTKDADFVLARKEGPYSDGRRPDWVAPGDLVDDLARRDFTVNAIAKNPLTGQVIDPFNGRDDLVNEGLLRFVGIPEERIIEDGLRVVRGLRFLVTKGFDCDPATWEALNSDVAVTALRRISIERIYDEITRTFNHDTVAAVRLFAQTSDELQRAIFRNRLHLTGSLKGPIE